MPRKRAKPDLGAVWRALPAEDRETVRRWERALSLPPGGWRAVPPLRETVVSLAVARLAADRAHLPIAEAIDRAAYALGIADDGEGTDPPAAAIARRFRRWRTAAARALVKDVHDTAEETP